MGFSLWILTMTTLVQVRYNCYMLNKKLFWNKSIIKKQEKSETTLSARVFVGFGGEHVLIMNLGLNYLTLVILKSQTPLSIVTNPLTHRIVAFTFPEICCIVVDIPHSPSCAYCTLNNQTPLSKPMFPEARWTPLDGSKETTKEGTGSFSLQRCLLCLPACFGHRPRFSQIVIGVFESCTIITIWSTLKKNNAFH